MSWHEFGYEPYLRFRDAPWPLHVGTFLSVIILWAHAERGRSGFYQAFQAISTNSG